VKPPSPTTPISLRRAAAILGWGRGRSAERRLSRYLSSRVCNGASDPRYRAGGRVFVTLRRLLAALPELDCHQPALAIESVPQAQPNQLLGLIHTIARQECKKCEKRQRCPSPCPRKTSIEGPRPGGTKESTR
jgi:hypothetical protein